MSVKNVFSCSLFLLACVASAWAAPCPQAAGVPELLDQNWDKPTRAAFWFTDQGSRLMPLSWFLNLQFQPEGSSNSENFAKRLTCYGLIPDNFGISGDFNKEKLPIGFAIGKKPFDNVDYVGLTCAACHTGVIRNGTRQFMIDGGPSMFDFDKFLEDLTGAMTQTVGDPVRWDRFAKAVASSGGTADSKAFSKTRDYLQQRIDTSKPTPEAGPAGFGRLDAFGHIFNQVVVALGKVPAHPSNTPSSFPALWDISQHSLVQWNSSAPNVGVGHDAPGALLRNIGEVVGVFGDVGVTPVKLAGILPAVVKCDRGSLQLENLRNIEEMVSKLRSPQWPFDKPAAAEKEAGEKIYQSNCRECHAETDRLNPPVPYPAKRIVLDKVGTDRALADKIGSETDPAGLLRGTAMGINLGLPFLRFGASGKVALLAAQVAFGLLPDDGMRDQVLLKGLAPALMSALCPGYKARPLNGVWATAPYLHNGSVPTLLDLLSTSRPEFFCVGDSEYDVEEVGVKAWREEAKANKCPPQTTRVDTNRFGSRNIGHTWGTALHDDEKRQLIAFLKTL